MKNCRREMLLVASLALCACGGEGGHADVKQSLGEVAPAPLGAECTRSDDCATSLCMTEHDNGWPGGFCAAECTAQSPCPGAGKCLDFGPEKGVCLIPCTPASGACRDGYACTDVLGDGSFTACLPSCAKDAQCQDLGTCNPTTRMCVAAEADCDNGKDDDGDGLIDCEDPSRCKGSTTCASGTIDTGLPCDKASDCKASGGEPACLRQASGFPGGYCSEYCEMGGSGCATPGSICVDRHLSSGHGMCMRSCVTADDCRAPDYGCLPTADGSSACQPY